MKLKKGTGKQISFSSIMINANKQLEPDLGTRAVTHQTAQLNVIAIGK